MPLAPLVLYPYRSLPIVERHSGLSIATSLAQFWTIHAHIVRIMHGFHGNLIGAIVVATLLTAETQFRVSLTHSWFIPSHRVFVIWYCCVQPPQFGFKITFAISVARQELSLLFC